MTLGTGTRLSACEIASSTPGRLDAVTPAEVPEGLVRWPAR
jgi:hypothetical protein